jgi:hypothetical protein
MRASSSARPREGRSPPLEPPARGRADLVLVPGEGDVVRCRLRREPQEEPVEDAQIRVPFGLPSGRAASRPDHSLSLVVSLAVRYLSPSHFSLSRIGTSPSHLSLPTLRSLRSLRVGVPTFYLLGMVLGLLWRKVTKRSRQLTNLDNGIDRVGRFA